jgi:hypothetical protein
MRIVPLLVVIALLVVILYLPIPMPWKLVSIGQVFPQKSWKISQDATGNLLINLTDFRTGETTVSSNYQFERGDLVEARLRATQDSVGLVRVGDTVLVIRTNTIQDRLTTLRGQLLEAESRLSSGQVGEKPPIVEAAESKLRFDEQELANLKTTNARQKALFAEQNLSAQDVENSNNLVKKAQIQVEIDQRNLESAQTGLKLADIDLLKSSTKNLQSQILFLEKQTTKYVLTAPFDGHRQRAVLPADVFTLHQAREYFLQIPIKVEDLRWINKDSKINIRDVQTGKLWPAKFIGFAPKVDILSGRRSQLMQVSVQTAENEQLSTGLSVDAEVDCGVVNMREYLKRVLNF